MALGKTVAQMGVSVWAKTQRFAQGMQSGIKGLLGFQQAGKKASFATKVLNAQMAWLIRSFSVIAAGRIVWGSLRGFEQFNREMAKSMAIMGGLTKALRKDMREAAIETSRTTIFSAREAAKAYFYLASAGLDARQSLAALPTVATFAQAGMFDLATATDLVTDAQSALGMTVDDTAQNLQNMKRVGDVLVKANTLANATVRQFSEALTTKAAASAKLVGKEIEEVVSVLAAFADQGTKGAEAGTAFNIVMRDLQTQAIKNAGAFKEANIHVFDANWQMANLRDIVRDLEDALEGLNDTEALLLVKSIGLTDKSRIFTQQLVGTSGSIRDFQHALASAAGTMDRVAKDNLTPLQESLNELGAAWETVMEFFGPLVVGGAAAELKQLTADVKTMASGMDEADSVVTKFRKTQDKLIEVFQKETQGVDELTEALKHVAVLKDLAPWMEEVSAGTTIWVDALERRLIPQLARARHELELMKDAGKQVLAPLPLIDPIEMKRLIGVADDMYKRTRTPFEKFSVNLREAFDVFRTERLPGGIETVIREVERLSDIFKATLETAKEITVGTFGQIKTGLITVQGLPPAKYVQEVRDPQLAQVIQIAQAFIDNLQTGNVRGALATIPTSGGP